MESENPKVSKTHKHSTMEAHRAQTLAKKLRRESVYGLSELAIAKIIREYLRECKSDEFNQCHYCRHYVLVKDMPSHTCDGVN